MDKVLANIIKNTSAYRVFDRDIENSFCHAYLIISPDTLAQNTLVELVTLRVYCKTACSLCTECKKILSGVKPDVKTLNPDGKNVTVEQISEMINSSYLSPVERGEKLYIIKNFDNQSVVVQNKLLKTLEEPPESVHVILTASSTIGILPTVLSRVKKVTQSLFRSTEIKKWLLAMGVESADEISKAAGGSFTLAQTLASDEKFFDNAYELLNVYNSVKESGSVPRLLKNKVFTNLAEALNITEIIFKDVLYTKAGLTDYVTLINFRNELRNLSEALTITAISNIMSEVIISKQKLSCFVTEINIIDCFLLKIAEEKSKCKK